MNLITNISQIRAFSTINVTSTLAQWQPYLDEAEETFIRPLIGAALLDELKEFEQGSSSSEDLTEELLEKVRKPLALYALNLGADEMAVSISGSGIQVVLTESHKPAPQYQIQNLKESWMKRAHVAMDLLLAFLEEHKTSFNSYVSQYNDLFIGCAAEFQLHQDIHNSRRVYITLLPLIRSIENKYIRPTLSTGYFHELKEAMQSSTDLSDDDRRVVDLIRPALAHLTIARALQEITIDVLDWGVFLNASSTFDNVMIKQLANRDKISLMVTACQQDGEAELKELQQHLDKNASSSRYKTYFDSDRYIGQTQDPLHRNEFKNDINNSFFLA